VSLPRLNRYRYPGGLERAKGPARAGRICCSRLALSRRGAGGFTATERRGYRPTSTTKSDRRNVYVDL